MSSTSYSYGEYITVQFRVRVDRPWASNINVEYVDDDGESHDIAVPYDAIVTEKTPEYLESNGQTFKDARGLVFEGTAEEFWGDDVANRALDYARQLTENDDKTRTVLVVPGQSIDHALSFVNVGVRQVRHSELREEGHRLGL